MSALKINKNFYSSADLYLSECQSNDKKNSVEFEMYKRFSSDMPNKSQFVCGKRQQAIYILFQDNSCICITREKIGHQHFYTSKKVTKNLILWT